LTYGKFHDDPFYYFLDKNKNIVVIISYVEKKKALHF